MKILFIILVTAILYSCSKSNSIDPSPPVNQLSLLQQVWNIESLSLFADSNMNANYLYRINPVGNYYDFRSDGKVYMYGGVPTSSYDTASYKFFSDKNIFVFYHNENGIPKTDTGHIITLKEREFIFYSINPAKEYGKFVLKR